MVLQCYSQKLYFFGGSSDHLVQLHWERHAVNSLVVHVQILSGYFDTTIGHKQQSVSYKKICEAIHLSPAEVLFLTDVEQEARAAREAGMQVNIVVRDGNAPLSEEAKRDFTAIH
ncbi:putative 2,3-diketo-5-methylthio-1-phosphopentane phosphatase, partial [Cooperia oncophora]